MYKIKLSPYHKIFYNEWLLNPNSNKYNIVFDQTLSRTLNIQKLSSALYRFILDYVLFDSHIKRIDNELYWVNNNKINHLENFQLQPDENQIYKYVSRPFDLEAEPLYRFALFKVQDNYRLIMIFHHILLDGNSFTQLIVEISKYYNDESYQVSTDLSTQINLINKQVNKEYFDIKLQSEQGDRFWNEALSDIESINLRFLFPDNKAFYSESTSSINGYTQIKTIRFNFDDNITEKFNQLRSKFNLSIYGYGQIIFAILLYKYTYNKSFGITYPIAMKKDSSIIYGSMINTNIFPYQIEKTTTILELIKYYNGFIRRSYKYKHILIHDILNNKDKNLLDIYFAQVDLQDTEFNFDGVEVLNISEEFYVCFGVKLDFEQQYKNSILNYRVRYNELNINKNLLLQFINHYKKLFVDVIYDLENNCTSRYVGDYPILNTKQGWEIYDRYNTINKCNFSDKTIHEYFEKQANLTPNKIALVYMNETITYTELNKSSNQLSHYLMNKHNVMPNNLIGIFLERSPYTLIAILAVLKSGAAYLPIDTNYPDDMVKYILKDTKAHVIISQKNHASRLKLIKNKIDNIIRYNILLDSTDIKYLISEESNCNPNINITDLNHAYVIYTSGTTGKPKGVIQQHKTIISLFESINNLLYDFTTEDVWVLFHSYAFDFSIWEMWGALFYGGKLIIPTTEQVKNLELFYEVCKYHQVTVLNQTPSSFYQFSEIAINKFYKSKLSHLKYIIFGGESLQINKLVNWVRCYGFDKPQLINMYGITETGVHNTYKLIDKDTLLQNSVIGKSIPNKILYVLDRNLQLVPYGAIGELYIGGYGLATEYLNLPDLTQEKFIRHPFFEISYKRNKLLKNDIMIGEKLYKTGDIVRILSNGDIDYVGREDSQIKIRGYRIEIGHIENKLNNYPEIKNAIVVMKERNGYNYLVGYYVSERELNSQSILDYLANEIPEYMMPASLIHLKKFPLNINGKLDKTLLPHPQNKNSAYLTPITHKEKIICQIFANILGIKKIGVEDDFFKLGGNSISAIKLLIQLQHDFEINLNEIFKLKNPRKIAEIAIYVKNNLPHKLHVIKQVGIKFAEVKSRKINNIAKNEYLRQISNMKVPYSLKKLSTVMLTGSTGHLGCNILNKLLKETQYKIYLLVRADSDKDAYIRIKSKYHYYFDENFDNFGDRILVLASHLEKTNLGVDISQYQNIIDTVDSIIHSAALVKHYGDYQNFYDSNVQSTINLLELAKLTKSKDFHYISTLGIFLDGYVPNHDFYVFHEECGNEVLQNKTNLYTMTKYEGELLSVKYRAYGVNTNIYRVGNLSIHSQTYKTQENIEENSFFIKSKFMLNFGMIPKELSEVEISPVDYTALAIVKLFNQTTLKNQTFHLFNPYKANLFELFYKLSKKNVIITPLNNFIDNILLYLEKNHDNSQIELFMLHQMWLKDIDPSHITVIDILNDKTNFILSQLGFCWTHITSEMLSDLVNQSFKRK